MTGPRLGTRALAAIALAVALAIGTALVATGGPAARPIRPHRPAQAVAPPPPPSDAFPRTPGGAVAAATNWHSSEDQAVVDGTVPATYAALAVPGLHALGARVALGSDYWRSRLATPGGTPYVLRDWPLGYRVVQYSPPAARVFLWTLQAIETDEPHPITGYETATITLRWLRGTWKFAGEHRSLGLAPPGQDATPDQITAWIDATSRLRSYTYAP